MRLKNLDIFCSKEPLQRLMEQELPVKYAIQVARLAKKLEPEMAVIEQQRNGLIIKYGTLKDNSYNINPDSEKWDAFVKDHDELMDLETEVIFSKAQIPDSISIPVKDLMFLDEFIEIVDAGN